jgi:hypothetical protein
MLRTEQVSGSKLPSPLEPVKAVVVAAQNPAAAVLCNFATRVLNTGTESAWGHEHASRRSQSCPVNLRQQTLMLMRGSPLDGVIAKSDFGISRLSRV